MDDTNQKKKLLLIGIIATLGLFVVILVVLMILMNQDAKNTKVLIGNQTYKTKIVELMNDDGSVYKQKNITYQNKEVPVLLITPDGKNYFCIETIASLTGYKYNKGAYGELDENTNKCYIDNGGEYVTFSTESDSIAKNIKKDNGLSGELVEKKSDGTSTTKSGMSEVEEEELFSLENPVIKFVDGKLYASYDAVTKGFNMSIVSDESQIVLYTLDNLVQAYSSKLSQNGYTLTSNFKNRRALCDGFAVVGRDNLYGVVNLNDYTEATSIKYDTVEYVQSIGEFIISSSSNYGMIAPNAEKPTISLKYESIQLLDAKEKLYIVETDSKYGVVNSQGDSIIPTEYDQIGLNDISSYKGQNIKNKYLIADTCIPVKRNGLYGLFSKDGYTLARTNYTSIGCEDPSRIISDTGAMPTLTVPLSKDITCIVFSMKNNVGDTNYGMMTTDGTIVCQAYYTAIYYMTSNGKQTYYFNKVNNNELTTLDELVNTRSTLKNLIQNKNYKKKSQEVLEEDTRAEQEKIMNENSDKNNQESDSDNNNGNDDN